ncbi:S-adenosyl-L-methionine-dependent methyltransferase [Thermothelomyces heterothallicus CBS 202.75]|uniref:S-adenosyl-L-methionine-dependent methyltransferase n=1 Tax=Thermothelomyces heterothallicus CBS 202.75 TaxID=1149848 RepID=UPI003741EB10
MSSPAKNESNSPAPAETKPAETKPAETKPAEEKPAETKQAESTPAAAASPAEASSSAQAQTSAESGAQGDILPGQHWTRQPINDADSSYDSEIASSTNSLTSSILAYRTINGRTYHSDRTPAEYWGPNDEKQAECMDIQHHAFTLMLDGALYKAPLEVDKIKKVLDVGTGTGIWAIDFADEHPNVEVIGTDISPIQPGWVPPNVFFEMEDATQAWTFAENSFDFVHMRYLYGSIADWNQLFREAYRVVKPGGYIETFEADSAFCSDDGTIKEGSAMDQWSKVFEEGGRKFGRTFMPVSDNVQRTGLEAAGFVNLVQHDFKVPLTAWPADKKQAELGAYCHLAIDQDTEGLILYTFQQIMGWSAAEVHAYVAHLRKQMRDKTVHPYGRLRLIYAQKPL